MVHGPGVLLVHAGYSLTYGLLDDLYSYNLTSNTWSLVEVNQVEMTVPSARYLHSAVFHTVSTVIYGVDFAVGVNVMLKLTDSSLFLVVTT